MMNDIFNQRRMNALQNRRPLEYFEYCVATNTDHRENLELYSQGAALFEYKVSKGSLASVSEMPLEARYVVFHKKLRQLNPEDISANPDDKLKLIKACFPGRFQKGYSDNKPQKTRHLSDAGIGTLAQKLDALAERHSYDFSK